jgi:hypothetical protein
MGFVGYSRFDVDGGVYYSDADNVFIHWLQKLRGISTAKRKV